MSLVLLCLAARLTTVSLDIHLYVFISVLQINVYIYIYIYICLGSLNEIGCIENEIEVWEEEINDFNQAVEPDNQPGVLHPLIHWITHLIALLQKKHYIPYVAVSMLLQFLYAF